MIPATQSSWSPMRISPATTKVRVLPRRGEPLFSYVFRHALQHGHKTLSAYLSQTAGNHIAEKDIFNGHALSVIAQLVDFTEEDLGSSTFIQRDDGGWAYQDRHFPAGILSSQTLQLCPCCVLEQAKRPEAFLDGFYHVELLWMFPFIKACPSHNVELVSFDWKRNDIAAWQKDLLERAGMAVIAANQEDIDFARFVSGRLGLSEAYGEVTSLKDLSLDAALFAIKSIGLRLTRGADLDPDPESAAIYTSGFSALTEYDSKFDALFDRMSERLEPREHLYRPGDIFGRKLWESSRALLPGTVLREAIQFYASTHLKCEGDIIDSPRQVFDLIEVANEFGLRTSRLKRLRLLCSQADLSFSTKGPLSKEEAHSLTIISHTTITQDDLTRCLNLTLGQMSILRDLDIVRPLGGSSTDIRGTYVIDIVMDAWEEFVGSSPRLKGPGRDQIIFTKVHLLGSPHSFETCCQAIKTGTLLIAGHIGDHMFDHIVLNVIDVILLSASGMDSHPEPVFEDPSEKFVTGYTALAEHLRCSEDAAHYLHEHNIFEGEQTYRRGRRAKNPLFLKSEVEAFDETWIGPHEIERRYPDEVIHKLEVDLCRPNKYGIQDFPYLDRSSTEDYFEKILEENRQFNDEVPFPGRPVVAAPEPGLVVVLERGFNSPEMSGLSKNTSSSKDQFDLF